MPDRDRLTISATEGPALFNASPYITKFMLWQKFARGVSLDKEADNRMTWGKRMQPALLAAAADDQKLEVIPNAADTYVRGAGDFALLGCTRDATIIAPGIGPGALEIKMVFDFATWMREWDDTPPRHVEIQNQIQMAVGDNGVPFRWGMIGVFVCGEMKYYRREPIPQLWTALKDESAKFFDDVKNNREPDPFGAAVELPLLSECYPTIPGTATDFAAALGDEEALRWAEKIRMCAWHGGERLGHERAEKALKAEILGLLKDTAGGYFPHGITAAAKQQNHAGFTVAPTTFKVLKLHVPDNLPEGQLGAKGMEF